MTIVSSVAATALAKRLKNRRLPGVDRVQVEETELQRSLDAIREHLHMYEGDASAPRERFITIQELEDTGLIRTQIKNKFAAITEVAGVAVAPPASGSTTTIINNPGSGGTGTDKLVDLLDTSTLAAVNGHFLTYTGGVWHNFDLYNADIVITGEWRHNADVIMDSAIDWINSTADRVELLSFEGGGGTPATPGNSITVAQFETFTDSTETGTSYTDSANGLNQSQSDWADGDEILIVAMATFYNNNNSTANINGYRIVADDVEVLGSESLTENVSSAGSTSIGDQYGFVGWFEATTAGENVNSQIKRGSAGTEFVVTTENNLLLNLTVDVPNHVKSRTTTPVTTTGGSRVSLSNSIVLPAGDWLIYSSVTGNPGRGGTVAMNTSIDDGTTEYDMGGSITQDTSTDVIHQMTAIFLEDYAGGTFAQYALTAGNNCDVEYAALIAIPMSDFANHYSVHTQAATYAAAQNVEEDLSLLNVPSMPATTNYLTIGYGLVENGGTPAYEINANVNAGGETRLAWINTHYRSNPPSSTYSWGHTVSSVDAYTEADDIDFTLSFRSQSASYATDGIAQFGILVIQLNATATPAVPGTEAFVVGDPVYPLELHGTDVRMLSDVAISWYDAAGTLSEFLELDATTTVGLPTDIYSFQTLVESSETDDVTYQDTTNGLSQAQTAFTDGDEILVIATALLYNNNSSAAGENGYRVAVDGSLLAGSAMLCEGHSGTTDNDGNPYGYVGWFTADSGAGPVTTQLLLGDQGTSYNSAAETSLLLNLTQSVPNHQKADAYSFASPLDITDTDTPQLTGANVVVTAGDYMVFVCTQTGNHNGAANPEVGLNDGTTYYSLSGNRVTDSAGDQHVCAGAYFLEDYAGGTLSTTVMVSSATVNGDCTYASIVVIPMSDFASYNAVQQDDTLLTLAAESVAEDINTLSIGFIPTTANYIALAWGNTEMAGTGAIPGYQINEDVNGAGVTKIGHDQTYSGRKFTSTAFIGMTIFSDLRAYEFGDTVEITQSALTGASFATQEFRNHGLMLIEMNGNTSDTTGFIVGDPSYSTTIDGSVVDIPGTVTLGAATLDTLNVLGATDLDTTLNVDGLSTLASLNVTGVTDFDGNVDVNNVDFTITGPTPANNAAFSHDDTDLATAFANTVDWLVTGLSGEFSMNAPIKSLSDEGVHGVFEGWTNTAFPRAQFLVGSTDGDSITNAGIWFKPDITTGTKRMTMEVLDQNVVGASTNRFGLWIEDAVAKLGTSKDTGGVVGQDMGITTQGISNTDYDIYIDATTRDVTIGNYPFDGDQAVGATEDRYAMIYDDGTGLVSLEQLPSAVTGLGIWRYRTETAAPPSTGQLRFDDADISIATEFYLHETNDNSADVSTFLSLLVTTGSALYMQDLTDATKYVIIEIASYVDDGSYRTYQIANILEGSGGEPSQNARVTIVATSAPGGAATEVNDLTAAVVWDDIPIANVPTGTTGVTVALGDHTQLLASGATDVTATAAEVNLLDLAGLTAGWVLAADSATTASWQAPAGGGGNATPLDIIGDINMATPPIEAAFTGLLRIVDNDETDTVSTFGHEGAGALHIRNLVTNANMSLWIDSWSGTNLEGMRLDGGRSTTDYSKRQTAHFDTIKCGTGNTISFSEEDPPFTVHDGSFGATGASNSRIVMWGSGHIQAYSTALTPTQLRLNNQGGNVNMGGADQVSLGHDGSQAASTTTRANGGFQAWNNSTGGNSLERVLTTSDLFRTSTFTWKFETSTSASDPGTGDMRFNNATPASVTALYFDSFLDDVDGIDRTVDGVLSTLEAGDKIYLQNDYDISEYYVFEVTSTVDNTGWWTVNVTVDNVGGLPQTGVVLSAVFVKGARRTTNVGLTADVGSIQGGGVITATYNVYSTVGTAGDAATLPATSEVGDKIYIKNDGANSMDVFPASGDDAGAGTDTAVAVANGVGAMFLATVANATWTQMY